MLKQLDTHDPLGRVVIASNDKSAVVQDGDRRIELKRMDAHDVLKYGTDIKEQIINIDGMAFLKEGTPVTQRN